MEVLNMKLLQLKCPTCGAKLEVSDQLKSFTCNYCGQVTMLDDEIIKVEHKIIGNDKNEAYERMEGFFKLEYYDSALKLSYELTDKYPSDSQTWWYLIKAFTHDFTIRPDSEEFLDNLKEYFKNYTIFEKNEKSLEKNKEKYDEYLSKFDDIEFMGKVVFNTESASGLLCKFEIFIDGERIAKLSQFSSTEIEIPSGKHVFQVKDSGAFKKSDEYSFRLKGNETLIFHVACGGFKYYVATDDGVLLNSEVANEPDENPTVKESHEAIALECPYCSEKIKYGDKKCKSCGEELYWPEEK